MTDLLEQGASWLDRMRVKHASRTVLYGRGTESVEVAATLGRTDYEVTDEYGATVRAVATDFLIAAEDLVLGGRVSLPAPGDSIRVTFGSDVLVFEVMDLGGSGHYRPAGPHRKTLRIHARQVDREQA